MGAARTATGGDFSPARTVLADYRRAGASFDVAWPKAIEAVDRNDRAILRSTAAGGASVDPAGRRARDPDPHGRRERPARFDRAAARWVGLLLAETPIGLADARWALALVERLPAGSEALRRLARRR
jgi:hypothetical protein